MGKKVKERKKQSQRETRQKEERQEEENVDGDSLTWHATWNISQVCLIYFTCASGKGPIENLWKGEHIT